MFRIKPWILESQSQNDVQGSHTFLTDHCRQGPGGRAGTRTQACSAIHAALSSSVKLRPAGPAPGGSGFFRRSSTVSWQRHSAWVHDSGLLRCTQARLTCPWIRLCKFAFVRTAQEKRVCGNWPVPNPLRGEVNASFMSKVKKQPNVCH